MEELNIRERPRKRTRKALPLDNDVSSAQIKI